MKKTAIAVDIRSLSFDPNQTPKDHLDRLKKDGVLVYSSVDPVGKPTQPPLIFEIETD